VRDRAELLEDVRARVQRDHGDPRVARLLDRRLGLQAHPARGVRRALAQAQVQDLAGLRARGDDRVVAALSGVAERRALLGVAMDLADEAVDVDGQAP